MHSKPHPASFRDPSGFIFVHNNTVFRQVNKSYKEDYNQLMSSGLYDELVNDNMLIPHQQIGKDITQSPEAYMVIKPAQLAFLSYPYEWCFSQLKDAAILTLKIQKKALEHQMILKDASAYNVQFMHCKPIFIDTLSFSRYKEGTPWVAYKQFCQHFLAPLLMMKYCDWRFSQLLRIHLDGIPLDFAAEHLPFRTKFNFAIYTHIHLHSKYQRSFAGKQTVRKGNVSRTGLLGIVDSLHDAISKLKWDIPDTEWGTYYNDTNYSEKAFEHKKQLINEYLDLACPHTVFDLGANTGEFSRLASKRGIETIAFDIDPVAVEKTYLNCSKSKEAYLLPLQIDLTNPSPGLGWAHEERTSLQGRGPADMIFAFALIHHLAISNNLPLGLIADYFSELGDSLIIEFVPCQDSQVNRLLSTRQDIFSNYDQESFERAFSQRYTIRKQSSINDSHRELYFMVKRS